MTPRRGWRTLPLGEAVDVNPRRDPALARLAADTDVTFVPMAAVDEHSGTIARPEIRPFHEVKKGFTWFRENDVIFAKITPCMQNGKSAVARGLASGVGFGSTEFHVLRPTAAVLPEWIWYAVREARFLGDAKGAFKGSAGQQRVPADWLAARPIPVPPVAEQRRIIVRIEEALDRVAELERERRAVVAMRAALLPATLEDVFGAIRAPERALADLLASDPQNGLYLPKEEYSDDSADSVPMVHMGDMFRRFELASTLPRRVRANAALRAKYGLNQGDVLVARRSIVFEGSGSMTEVPELAEPALFESSVIRISPGPALLPGYLVAYFFSRSGTARRLAITRKATISGVNQVGLLSLEVPVPPLATQRRVVATVADVRRTIAGLLDQDSAAEVDALRSAVIRKAFAGEL